MYLIIGRKKPKRGDDFGGVVVLYELFLSYLKKKNIGYSSIDLNWRNYNSKITFLLSIYPKIILKILSPKHKSISFHGTTTDFTYYAPLVVLLGSITGKKVSLRKFGGSFDKYFENLGSIRKMLVRYSMNNADVVFFETKYLKEKFSWLQSLVLWFPNVREMKQNVKLRSEFQKKFVFISHIKESKGVSIILEALNMLPPDYTVHLYGPIQNYYPPDHLEKSFKKHYKGILQPYEVLKTMENYDVLILPTHHVGEGYPGAIIEAYSIGRPVISTKWRAIPEIVKEGETGLLIEPKSYKELIQAIQKINDENYSKLSQGALNYFQKFDQNKVMERIIKYL